MSKKFFTLSLSCLLAACLTVLPGNLIPAEHIKYFHLDSIKTVSGKITEIKTETCYHGMKFIVILLDDPTSQRQYKVEVSPQWYFKIDVKNGDTISIKGSYTKTDDTHLLIAQTITSRDKVYHFRDKWGFPLWGGKGKHKNMPCQPNCTAHAEEI